MKQVTIYWSRRLNGMDGIGRLETLYQLQRVRIVERYDNIVPSLFLKCPGNTQPWPISQLYTGIYVEG